jgi:hypothetical protein
MSADFPSSYPVSAIPSASKPADVQTLQEAFAAALRSYGSEKSGVQTNSMLEVLRTDLPDTANSQDRHQQRREHQQQTDRSDFTQSDRKLLDQSELRSREMNADYQNRQDRQEMGHNAYRERVDRRELPPSAVPTAPPESTLPSESLPNGNPLSSPQQINGVENVPAGNQPLQASSVAANSAASLGQANAVLPMNVNAPVNLPVVSQSVPLSPVTVFTPLGRFGQPQGEADETESENDSEEPDEKKVDRKKKQPFAAFEPVRVESTRPVRQKPLRQPKESVSRPEISKIAEKPKEVEPERSRSEKAMADLLDAPAQNVTAQKKGEPNSTNQQYINRIAAACEAAAQYAAKNVPIRMKINLDHLGTLSLRFFHKMDKLALRFEAPSKETAQFLRNHLDGLKTLLAQRNVKIVDIEIGEE